MAAQVVPFIKQRESFLHGSKAFYHPLSLEKHETRLVQVLPGAWEDAIAVNVITVSLLDKPSYEALSYTWGDTDEPRKITVEGLEYLVTPNQYNALQHFRDDTELLMFWMDVISINQADDDEKAQQVASMGEIYSLGKQTRIWLGSADEFRSCIVGQEAENSMDFSTRRVLAEFPHLSTVLEQQHIPDADLMAMWVESCGDPLNGAFAILNMLAKDRHFLRMPSWQRGRDGVETVRSWMEAMLVLASILNAKWWTRVWVIQEVVLSSETPSFYVGRHSISLDVLTHAFNSFMKHFILEQCCFGVALAWAGSALPKVGRGLVESIGRMRDVVSKFREQTLHPSDLLALVAHREATRQHDYIYGVAALWDKELLDFPVPIDYTQPIGNVYAPVSWSTFTKGESLDALVYGCGTHDKQNIASWVQDYSYPENVAMYARRFTAGYRPDPWTAPEQLKMNFRRSDATWDQKDNSLSVLAKHIGTVNDVAVAYHYIETTGETPNDSNQDLKAIQEVLSEWLEFCRGKQQAHSVWELIFRKGVKNVKGKDVTVKDLEEWHGCVQHQEMRNNFADFVTHRITDAFHQLAGNTRLFSTGTYLGSGVLDTAIGDVVVGIAGSEYAYLLRPQPSSGHCLLEEPATTSTTDQVEKYFCLVGPCYVLDITPGSWDIEEFDQRVRIK